MGQGVGRGGVKEERCEERGEEKDVGGERNGKEEK